MDDFTYTARSNLWLFFLFILPSYILADLTNKIFFTYTMNSEHLFKIVSYVSVFVIDIILIGVHSYIESTMPTMSARKAIKKITFISAFIFSSVAIIVIALSGLFVYEGCGKEFNELYIASAGQRDPTFCFDKTIESTYFKTLKGEHKCKMPNKDYLYKSMIEESNETNTPKDPEKIISERIMYEKQASSCVGSLADYSNDVTICESLRRLNEDTTGHNNTYIKDSLLAECIKGYAINNKDWEACDPILATDNPTRQDTWEQCIKSIAWKTDNESLCNMIPASSRIRQVCIIR